MQRLAMFESFSPVYRLSYEVEQPGEQLTASKIPLTHVFSNYYKAI